MSELAVTHQQIGSSMATAATKPGNGRNEKSVQRSTVGARKQVKLKSHDIT
jgi:hypothetical protein